MNLGAKLKEFMGKLTIYDYIAIGIFITAFVVRLTFYEHCLWVDEARDLEITRNFMQTGKQLHFDKIYLIHPVLNYILLGLFTSVFGLNVFGGTMLSITTGALSVLFVYLIGKEISGPKAGLIMAFLMVFQPLHWFYSVRVLNNIPNTFFFILALYLFIKFIKTKNYNFVYFTAFATAFAILTRFSSAILLFIFLGYILIDKQTRNVLFSKKIIYAILILLGFGFIFLAYNYFVMGQFFDTTTYMQVSFVKDVIDAQPWWYYFVAFGPYMRWALTSLFLLGTFFSFMSLTKGKMKSTHLFLILALLLSFIIISVVSTKVDRYLLPIVPIVVIFAGYAIFIVSGYISKYNEYAGIMFILILCFLISASFYSEGSTMIKNLGTGFCGFDKAGDWIIHNTNSNDYIYSASWWTIGFYSDRDNLKAIPLTAQELDVLIDEGKVNYIILDKWERTQPEYIFNYVEENPLITSVGAILDEESNPQVIFYKVGK